MKKTLILTLMLAAVPALVFSQTEWTVRNTAGWIEAVNGIRSGGSDTEHVITVIGNVSVPGMAESTFGAVTGVTVTISGNGTLSLSSSGNLLQIGVDQTFVVKDITLKGRDANNASVVNILNGGTFRMEGKASVTGNKSTGNIGGVYVGENGSFTMKDSASVSGNIISYSNAASRSISSAGVTVSRGTFTMEDKASVSGNTSASSFYSTSIGGVLVYYGTFTMKDSASVSGNITDGTENSAGGVQVYRGTFTMLNNASISGNKINETKNSTGGVYVYDGTFTMQDNASISGNKSDDDSKDSSGGVYVHEGTFNMRDSASVSGNNGKLGGGVFVKSNGTFVMQGGTVSRNTADSGGGVYVSDGAFTMEGGTISGNEAGGGGGVYINSKTFIMRDGAISGNTALWYGGGVYNKGTFNMEGGTISGNTADLFYGGGVCNNGTFTKTNGIIYGDDTEKNLKNSVVSGIGHALSNGDSWRNATAGPAMNTGTYGFLLNEGEGEIVKFPDGFAGIRKRSNFNNVLFVGVNVMKSTSSNYYWVLQKRAGDVYTLKRTDAANTMTITIKLSRNFYSGNTLLEISGDSGSGENNWNGVWQ